MTISGYGPEAVIRPEPRSQTGPGVRPGRRGLFLTFEGIEGSGKTTQVAMLSERIEEGGGRCLVTREPGGTSLGRALRSVLLDTKGAALAPAAELALYVADRAQHLSEVVKPALEAGRIVLCDRYLDATLAYQGHGRGLSVPWIREIHSRPPLDLRPDRTILFDLDADVAVARARARNEELGKALTEGRFENEPPAFHRRVRDGYLELAAGEPFRWRIVRAETGIAEVHARVVDLLSDLIPELDEQSFS